jgi:hypothetical protein
VVGWNPFAVTASPHAAFHRRSNVTASTVSLSDNPCKVCNTITEDMAILAMVAATMILEAFEQRRAHGPLPPSALYIVLVVHLVE